MRCILLALLFSPVWAEIKEFPGGKELPHEKYIHVVPESVSPVGRGIERLAGWPRCDHGSLVFERFLQEGYVVVVADYRGGQNLRRLGEPLPKDRVSFVDDAQAVLHLIGRVKVRAAILGAPAPLSFLGASPVEGARPEERWKNVPIHQEIAHENIEPIQSPMLILVGTADGLIHLARPLLDATLAALESSVKFIKEGK
ncbi:MAG: hypothetical protein HY235_17165 [Acidobacteria bacterium]|nr:hypothetical protein [Acidobacteriota bacterium]